LLAFLSLDCKILCCFIRESLSIMQIVGEGVGNRLEVIDADNACNDFAKDYAYDYEITA